MIELELELELELDVEVIRARLSEVSRRLKRVQARQPSSIAVLRADEGLQDILARNLEVAIQGCNDIAAHVCGADGKTPATRKGRATTAKKRP